jgi:hypothetical protein
MDSMNPFMIREINPGKLSRILKKKQIYGNTDRIRGPEGA